MKNKVGWSLIALVWLGCVMLGWGFFTELSGGNELAMENSGNAWCIIALIWILLVLFYLLYKHISEIETN